MTDQETPRKQVKRDKYNQVRAATLSPAHDKLYSSIQSLYVEKFNLNDVSFSIMARRGLELLHDHLQATTNPAIERGLVTNTKSGEVNSQANP
ncbi:hypothetical protein MTBPR1_90175 [Candidatus Terasakiella magnetica]|uniref:Uncharacterized protein n=1 Tax=Candidatus Terasakiella magnetica TaxID=1867952 RepID=A0A1C3RM43_9PROT|nr:hypothetical protein [Candidatus Terasakiella magnetica]SCA58328.1 hypothetical protein MTBPR1_90175 [Candidatus Terasakiella magnetica]